MKFADLVEETSATAGTGDLTLAGATLGHQTFSSTIGTGSANSTLYAISDSTTNEWEIGIGYASTATNFVRSTVTASSNAGALVDFAANTKKIKLVASKAFFDWFGVSGVPGTPAQATGSDGIALGDGASAAGISSVAMGASAIVNADGAVAIGPAATVNPNGVIAIGNGAIASAIGAQALGYHTQANADFSTAVGYDASADHMGAVALGLTAQTMNYGALHLSSISLGGGDLCDTSILTAANKSTAGVAIPLYLDGLNQTLETILDQPGAYSYWVGIIGVQTGGSAGTVGDSWGKSIYGVAKNITGTVVILGTPFGEGPFYDPGAAGWAANVSGQAGGILRVSVTGEANKNISWGVTIKLTRVTYGGGM